MKTKRIWIWSFVFGLLATLIVYIGVFSDLTVASSSAESEVKKEAAVQEETTATQTVPKRKINNPIIKVSEGNRAISLRVALESGVSGYIEPGSYVDVIAYETTKDEAAKKEYKSALLVLENKKVLASGKASDMEGEALLYETVTLEVTPDEGVMLSLASKDKDGFYFMLRNNKDTGVQSEVLKHTREVIKEGSE